MNEHSNIHFDGTNYTCHICPKKYTRSNKLKPHLIANHFEPIARFKCELCSEVFEYEVTLKTHLANHVSTPAISYNCTECTKEFAKETDFLVHGISHKPLLKCDYCYRSFRLPIFMDKHLEIHDQILYENDDNSSTGKHNYNCDLCSAVVSTKIGIWKHLKSHTESLQCEFCFKTFKNFDPKLRSHLQMHITKALQVQKNYQCENCPLEFDGKAILEDHVLKYHKSKLYKSKYCTKQFGNRFVWSKHNKEHASKQRQQCKECLKCIPANRYEKHQQMHAEGKQPYSKCITTFWTCNICDRNLTNNADLRNHFISDHQMNFPVDPSKWKCEICGDEMFLWGLMKHLRKVHGREFLQATKKYECIDCSMVHSSYGRVYKHMKRYHAERVFR